MSADLSKPNPESRAPKVRRGEATNSVTYFLPETGGFWKWNGDTLVWTNGKTLCFREELLPVLNRLAPHGLPSLSTVALFLALLRKDDAVRTWQLEQLRLWKSAANARSLPDDWLDRIQNFSESARECLEGLSMEPNYCVAALAEVCFAHSPRGFCDDDSGVVRLLKNGYYPSETDRRTELMPAAVILQPFLRRFPVGPDEFTTLCRTGLQRFPDAIETEAVGEVTRRMLADLKDDPEWSGLAGVSREIMAMLSLPRRIGDADELAVGGVSDIVNRGPLDRLLVSELAQDDAVLAMRVALNEALYLRRESPPHHNRVERFVFVDNGLRMWGLPRVLAGACALGLAANTGRTTGLRLFAPNGMSVESFNPLVKEDWLSMFGGLQTHSTPEEALTAFARKIPANAKAEILVIGGPHLLTNTASLTALDRLPGGRSLVVTVDRDGTLELYERKAGRHLSQQRIAVQGEAWRGIKGLVASTDPSEPGDWPAALRACPFPLRFAASSGDRALAFGRPERFHFTHDKRLLCFPVSGNVGGTEILSSQARGELTPIANLDGGDTILMVNHCDEITLTSVDLENNATRRIMLAQQESRSGILHGFQKDGIVFLVTRRVVTAFSPVTGNCLHSLTVGSRIGMYRSDIVLVHDRWHRIAFDEGRVALRNVSANEKPVPPTIAVKAAPPDHDTRPLRRLRSVAWSKRGDPVFVAASGSEHRLLFHKPTTRLVLQESIGGTPHPGRIVFEKRAPRSRERFSLGEARFPDGSVIWTDSRGFTHWRSSDRDLPEFALLMRPDGVSGWSTLGEAFGDPYFLSPENRTVDASCFRDYIQQFGAKAHA